MWELPDKQTAEVLTMIRTSDTSGPMVLQMVAVTKKKLDMLKLLSTSDDDPQSQMMIQSLEKGDIDDTIKIKISLSPNDIIHYVLTHMQPDGELIDVSAESRDGDDHQPPQRQKKKKKHDEATPDPHDPGEKQADGDIVIFKPIPTREDKFNPKELTPEDLICPFVYVQPHISIGDDWLLGFNKQSFHLILVSSLQMNFGLILTSLFKSPMLLAHTIIIVEVWECRETMSILIPTLALQPDFGICEVLTLMRKKRRGMDVDTPVHLFVLGHRSATDVALVTRCFPLDVMPPTKIDTKIDQKGGYQPNVLLPCRYWGNFSLIYKRLCRPTKNLIFLIFRLSCLESYWRWHLLWDPVIFRLLFTFTPSPLMIDHKQ
jgi:hypothetical protein